MVYKVDLNNVTVALRLLCSVTYVYYEQYIGIVYEGLVNLSLCLIPTFVVCCILLGMDLRSGLLNLLTILMITVDTVGVMTLWGIDYNAVSLINLVTVSENEIKANINFTTCIHIQCYSSVVR